MRRETAPKRTLRWVRFLAVAVLIGSLSGGCATCPYIYGTAAIERPQTLKLQPGEPQVERGRPNWFLDNVSGWIWPDSLLGKLMLWSVKVDNHKISAETEAKTRDYLHRNGLHNVKVRLNQYRPGAELMRTVRNRGMGPFWRFTFGMMGWFQYTIMPGRFFGGDHYNPYSNTINLYSDHIGIALHESGHAKDIAYKRAKGAYMLLYMAPLGNLWHESRATADALGYLRAHGELRDQKAGYNILYPAYGTYIAANATGLSGATPPWDYAIVGGTVLTMHVIARIKSATLREEAAPAPAPAAVTPGSPPRESPPVAPSPAPATVAPGGSAAPTSVGS